MAKIGLRAYLREIENLIDRGQLTDAQAHCKHILSIYPKQLDAYRLLGKSYLEAQRFPEAEDLFQRVLSSVPDDFIAQIGMSVIREEESNLDAALWHMERAYEVQPSNATIMGELKRLYGRRDGAEPQKIRLTRGALVRMYARTNLFPQAVAEARAALEEDANRIDLQIILARMLFQTNQKVEASELCSRIISKYPFCLEANRILSEILPGTSKAEEARIFHDRVIALDPYATFISNNTPTSDLVPENAVQIEHLENVSSASSWSIGSDASLQAPEGFQPDWMRATMTDQPVAAETTEPVIEDNPVEGTAAIPEWMKDAGWMPSKDGEEHPPADVAAEQTIEAAPIPADIPEWLRNIQPEPIKSPGSTDKLNLDETEIIEPKVEKKQATPPASAEGETMPDWIKPIEKVTAKPEVTIPDENITDRMEVVEKKPEISVPLESEINAIKKELESPLESAPLTMDSLKADVPMKSDPVDLPPMGVEVDSSDQGSAPNDWLEESNFPPTTGKTGPILPSVELPEWLKEIEITPEGDESLRAGKTGPIQDGGILPDWLKETQGPAETPERIPEAKVEPEKMIEPEPVLPMEQPKIIEQPVAEIEQETPKPDVDLNQWLSQVESETEKPEGISAEVEEKVEVTGSSTISEPIIETPVFKEEPPKPAPSVLPKARKLVDSGSSIMELQELKEDLESKRLPDAARKVDNLLRTTSLVDDVINQLLTAQQQFINEAQYWQIIGDAFKKKGNFRKALESYNKAEDLCQ